MNYKELFDSLVAYCQRVGVLSSDSSVYEEISEICGIDENAVAELID